MSDFPKNLPQDIGSKENINSMAQTGNSRSEIPYLNVNDLIITSGNDLYDGKLID